MVQFPRARFNGILGKSASCRPHLSCVIANRRADTPPPSLRSSAAALVWQSRTWRNASVGAGRFPRQCAHCLGMTKRCHGEPARRRPSPVIANQCRSTGVAISDVEKRISRCKKIPTAVCALPRNDEKVSWRTGAQTPLFCHCEPVPQHWCGNLRAFNCILIQPNITTKL